MELTMFVYDKNEKLVMYSAGRFNSYNVLTKTAIWRQTIRGHLAADISCFEKRTVFFEEQIMTKQ